MLLFFAFLKCICSDAIHSFPINVFSLPKKTDYDFMDSIKKCLKNKNGTIYLPTNTTEAKNHYDEINKIIQKYQMSSRPAYHNCHGPFLENEFIRRYKDKPLSYFSPFIPLFVPWFGLWKINQRNYRKTSHKILDLLKPNYLYFVVSESDFGFTGDSNLEKTLPPNVLVFSASGMGHVAVPWLQCSQYPQANDNPKKDIQYKHFISFCGNSRSSSQRIELMDICRTLFGSLLYEYRGPKWEDVIYNSLFSLSPRGIAVATYRTYEILRMESIPVIITTDIHWLPYYPKLDWNRFSILTNKEELPRTAIRLRTMDEENINQLKKEIHNVTKDFFTWEGFFKRLDEFFSGEDHYFSCSRAFLT